MIVSLEFGSMLPASISVNLGGAEIVGSYGWISPLAVHHRDGNILADVLESCYMIS